MCALSSYPVTGKNSLSHNKINNGMKVIAVTGGKGGVGKTNIASNLSIALAKLSQKVMLLDADMGLANIDVLLYNLLFQ